MGRASRPKILLAFADPRRDLGNGLKRETNGSLDALRRGRQCEPIVLQHPSWDDIARVFREHRNQIVAFHYGGHADSFLQMLESATGERLFNAGSG